MLRYVYVVWCSVVWCGVVWCGMLWYGYVVWCSIVWCGVVSSMVCYGIVWYVCVALGPCNYPPAYTRAG